MPWLPPASRHALMLPKYPDVAKALFSRPGCANVTVPFNISVLDDVAALRGTPAMELWLPVPRQKQTVHLIGMDALPPGVPSVHVEAFFVAKLQRAAVAGATGSVFNQQVLLRCGKWYFDPPGGVDTVAPRQSELVSFVQIWGGSLQHFLLGVLPLMDAATPFLRAHPSATILLPGTMRCFAHTPFSVDTCVSRPGSLLFLQLDMSQPRWRFECGRP